MVDRAGRAARREARVENQANVFVDIGRDVDGGDQNLGHRMGRVSRRRIQPPKAVPPLAMDPGLTLTG